VTKNKRFINVEGIENNRMAEGKRRFLGRTRKVLYHTGPAGLPAAAGFAYWLSRDDVAKWVDENALPNFRIIDLTDDPGRDLAETVEGIGQEAEDMPVEKALGEANPTYDVQTELGRVIEVLKAIDEDYNTLGTQAGRVKSVLEGYATRVAVNLGDFVVEKAKEVEGLGEAIEGLREINDWNTWNTVRPTLESRYGSELVGNIEAYQNDGMTLSEALNAVQTPTVEIDETGARDAATRSIDKYTGYLDSIVDTYGLQKLNAELAEGWGNVVEQALQDYKATRDPQALDTINEYVQKHAKDALSKLEEDYDGSLSGQHAKIKGLLGELEDLKSNTADHATTLEAIRDVYVELGNLRGEYETVGENFPPQDQREAIAGLDTQLAGLEIRTDDSIEEAREDPAYLAINPDPARHDVPHPLAYDIADGGAALVTGTLVVLAGWTYVKRTIKGTVTYGHEAVKQAFNRGEDTE
jgi:chaperonin cofactor prefoldin